MKNLFNYIFIAAASFFLTSCNGCGDEPQVSRYETRYGPNGDSTVYVHYVDDRGNDRSFFMDYLLFSSLYNAGGYRSCYGYYNSHPAYFNTPHYAGYSNYRSRTVINNHYGNSNNRSSNYNSTNRSRISSSPSRGSNSPSRSYSSPSRSYSSPSRSSSSRSSSFSRGSSSRSSSSRGSSSRH